MSEIKLTKIPYEELQKKFIEANNEKFVLQKRIEQAIEMIEKMTENELNDITYKSKHYLVYGSDFGEGSDIILEILKGEDKND